MRRYTIALALLTVPALAAADTCPSVRPGPTWACVNGGWLPPDQAPPAPTRIEVVDYAALPPPQNTPNPNGFKVGHTYERTTPATGLRLYITGLTQTKGGINVYAAECLNAGDGCLFPGEGRFILANAATLGFVEVP